jgi:phosphotriesterase-related protein
MQVMTVRGPVNADTLGVTLPHEHLLMDLAWPGLWPATSPFPELAEEPVTIELLGLLRRDLFVTHDNLRLLDPDLAGQELAKFASAGGQTICEVSTEGIGRLRSKLPEISEKSGVNVVLGCGWYVGRSHPDYVAIESIEQLEERLIQSIREGFWTDEGHQIRAGLIGEIGTSGPLTPDESKCLRASVRASHKTGVGVSIHLSSWHEGEAVPAILRILDEERADPARVALGHMCMGISKEHRLDSAKRGFKMEFDTFGYEGYYIIHEGTYGSIWQEPRDIDRIGMILELLDLGFDRQILVSQDIYTKTALCHFGGYGYAHILQNVVPMLKRTGFDDALIRRILIENPRDFLAANAS